MQPASDRLWEIYGDVLAGAELAKESLTAAEEADYQRVYAALYTRNQSGVLVESLAVCTLKNRTNRKFLQYEKQTWGINLGWTDNAEPSTEAKVDRWTFLSKGENKAIVKYGELIALAWGDSFVRYGERTVGINLDWSKSPKFEWQLLGGPPGTPVRTDEWLCVLNTRSEGGEPLIHFDRTAGGDIGWPSSKTWTKQLKEIGTKFAKDAIIDHLKGGKS